jgi:hypothetical protein
LLLTIWRFVIFTCSAASAAARVASIAAVQTSARHERGFAASEASTSTPRRSQTSAGSPASAARSSICSAASSHRDFHGVEPPDGWREATPDDIRAAAGHERPHVCFGSAPCKGFSGLLSESRSTSAKYQALNQLALRGLWLALELVEGRGELHASAELFD